jgi:flagellar biosynthetic protein FliO
VKNWFSDFLKKIKPAGIPQWLWGVILLAVIIAGAMIVQQVSGPSGSERAAVSATGSAGMVLDIILKLTFLLGLIFIGLYFVRRWQRGGRGTGSRRLRILESKHLSPKQAVHVIQAGHRVFLIGATDHGLSMLSELDPESPDADNEDDGVSFADELARSAGEWDDAESETAAQVSMEGTEQP